MEEGLTTRGLSFTQMIYSGDKVRVYEARNSTGQLFVVKDMTFSTQTPYEKAYNEVQVSWNLSHPNIMKCLDTFYYYSSQITWQLVLIFEKMPKDLMKEIRDRGQQRYHWTEEELMWLFSQMIDAFAYMQYSNVCHRDIKPQNILIDRLSLKVTDFGTSKQRVNTQELQTMAGTPFFLSPQLKAGLLESAPKVAHNVYKSDVYSLGLTFLTMVKLEPPSSLTSMKNLEQMTEIELHALPCSDSIKSLLKAMLTPEESQRMDFLQLQAFFKAIQSTVQTPPIQPTVKTTEETNSCNGCDHVRNGGSTAVVMTPCHGYLCESCVTYSFVSKGNYQVQCKLCTLADDFHTADTSKENCEAEETVGFSEYKGSPMKCRDCRKEKKRSEMVPVPEDGKLLCADCQGVYEKYYRKPFGQELGGR